MDTFLITLQQTVDFIMNVGIPEILRWTIFLAIIWLPAILIPSTWRLWTRYTRMKWIAKQKFIVLEVKLPQETFKSPAAMELFLNALIQTGGEGTPVDRYWSGKTRPWCSLEFASIDGEVRFFIWCFENQKNFITANIYAQYPDIGVFEIKDYTDDMVAKLNDYNIWACEYKLVKPDPYPIKTYIDFGLSEDPDEELKIDPIAPLIELLGSIRKEDQIWYQFIVKAHKAESTVFNGKLPDKLVLEAKTEVDKIVEKTVVIDKEGNKIPNLAKLSESKKDLIKALERSIAKPGFDVGIRAINLVPKDKGPFSIGILKGGFRPFGTNELNGLAPNGTEFDYPWQDSSGKIARRWAEELFYCYRKRSYFHPPYTLIGQFSNRDFWRHFPIFSHFFPHEEKQKVMVLNTEELATLYHFPGSVVKTPALKRIPSKRADAPANLPV